MRHAHHVGTIRTSGLLFTLSLAFSLAPAGQRVAHAQSSRGAPAATAIDHARAVARDALRFEPNVGQFDPTVRYVARGRSFALFLTEGGPTLALHRRAQGGAASPAAVDEAQAVVTMKIKGAASVQPHGVGPLPGRSHYFVGARENWRSDVETYARVRYEQVLPGIDVEYHGTEGRELEYDFSLAPGVSARGIELELHGVSRLEIASDGRAVLHLNDGSALIKEPPIAYQERDGRRSQVPVRYELRAGNLGFAVGAHDAALPLVIDPVLTYSTYFGGSSFDQACAIAADSNGNMYVVGYTASTLFPTSSPEQPVHGGGSYDAFVVKLNPSASGSPIVYSTYLGGSGADIAYGVAADAQGNAYVAGLTSSANFPVLSALQAGPGGAQDGFVAKLNSTGSALTYSTYLGGANDDYAKGIAVTGAGSVFVVGTTFSANFPTTAPLQANLRGAYDAFVTQINPAGSARVYSTFLGGAGTEYGNAIALDTLGNAYVVGSTTSVDFPTVNARQPAHAGGGTDAFVSKINAAGSGFVYSTYWGGSASDQALGVAVAVGTAIVVGDTLSSDFPLAFAAQPVPGGNNHTDAFITRFDPSGSSLQYSTYLGGTGNDSATAVAADQSADAYVVGQTDSSDLPLQQPIDGQGAYHGAGDAFVAALIPSGTHFVYSSYLGGALADAAVGVAVAHNTTYVAGNTQSADFPKVSPIFNGLVGSQDSFVTTLPSIESVAAPAVGWRLSAVMACFLLALALMVLNARGLRRYRSAR